MTINEVVLALMSGGSILTSLILRYLDRKKFRAEVASAEQEMYQKLLVSINKELEIRDLTIKALRKKESEQEDRIRKQNGEIKKLHQKNRACEEANLILKVEIDLLRKTLTEQIGDYEKIGVFVLDDAQIVTLSFKAKLEKSSMIDVQVFNDVESFMAAIGAKKPSILIIDYYLNGGKTAEGIIDNIRGDKGYDPVIIVMSKDDREELKDLLNAKGISKFYVKDNLYIFDIVKYVLKFAETRLS